MHFHSRSLHQSASESRYKPIYFGQNKTSYDCNDNIFQKIEVPIKNLKQLRGSHQKHNSECEYSYERQEGYFVSFAAKEKSKYHFGKKINHINQSTVKVNNKLGQQKFRQKQNHLQKQNQQLRIQIKELKNRIKRLQRLSKQSNKLVNKQLNQKMISFIENDKYSNLYQLSDDSVVKSLHDREQQILTLLKEAESEIRKKNEQIQNLKIHIQRQKQNQKEQDSVITKTIVKSQQQTQVDQIFKEILDIYKQNQQKYSCLVQRIKLFQKQVQVLKDKFINILEIIKKSDSEIIKNAKIEKSKFIRYQY